MDSVVDGVGPEELVERLSAGVAALQALDLDALTAREELALVRSVEVLRRRLDHGTDRLVGHLDDTGRHGVDGHKTAKAALKHLGRLPGAEAFARLRTQQLVRLLPAVAAGYETGVIPTAHVRAIARTVANPRVRGFLDEMTDVIFAEQAAQEPYDDFVAWLRQWESLADADGAEQDSERTHRRRNATVADNEADGSWHLRANTGALQGAAMAEIFAAHVAAEWESDRADAVAAHGEDVTPDQFARTPAQRRADALFAIFRRAGATPADAVSPEPLVNVIIDVQTLETELARLAGDPDAQHRPDRVDHVVCRTTTGHRLHPSDAVAALLVGHVRRVVVDAASTVIDLGRKRRCFTGSARDAALLQAAVAQRSGIGCIWAGCHGLHHQVDHDNPWRTTGPTKPANANIACGDHNRLKEAGFRPIRGPDGTTTLARPDGTTITPSA